MRIRQDQRGFVLSGTALLLILPAMLLAASFFEAVTVGGESASLQATSDKVFYTGKDIERVIDDIWDENLLFDNEPDANATFVDLEENYRAATGLLVDITPTWMLWTHVEDTDENRYAGTIYCKVNHVTPENWRYYFEDKDDWDYNEPILLVEKLDNNLRITIEDYDGAYHSDIYYSSQQLWDHVGGLEKNHVGENTEIDETIQLTVSIYVRDPRGTARYSSTVELG